MNQEQENTPVLSVLRGPDQQWRVTSQDLREPLASFDNPHAACAWAIAHAKPQRGRVFLEELASNTPSYMQDGADAPETFKFSIPVTWIDTAVSRR